MTKWGTGMFFVAVLALTAAFGGSMYAMNVNATAQNDLMDFAITATSVRLGKGTADDPTGLRFKTDVDQTAATALGSAAEWYTKISFTASNGNAYEKNVPATVWRTEDGYGWNTVLLDIPSTDYQTDITAQSFVKADGNVLYQTEPALISLAQAASLKMNAGGTDAQLISYTSGAVQAIALDRQTANFSAVGETISVKATTTPADYGVVWASDNTGVATVDKDGKVTAVANGTANITATMSGITATCAVSVGYAENVGFEDGGTYGIVKTMSHASALAIEKDIGETGNSAYGGFAGGESVSTITLDVDYLNWVFGTKNADYFTFDLYLDRPYLHAVFEGNAATAYYLYGSSSYDPPYITDYMKGVERTLNGNTLYRYSVDYPKAAYERLIANGKTESLISLVYVSSEIAVNSTTAKATFVQKDPTKMYVDNFKVGRYGATENFSDGSMDGGVFLGAKTNRSSLMSAIAVHGEDYAYEFVSAAELVGQQNISLGYLHYIFNVYGADSLTFKVYMPDGSNSASFYFALNNGSEYVNVGNKLTSAYDSSGCFTVTLSADFYHTAFDKNGLYIAGSVSGISDYASNSASISFLIKNLEIGESIYFDDFTAVKNG